MTVYNVIAYRYGDNEKHSYPVGVFDTITDAQDAASAEVESRGGKYDCFIYEHTVGMGRKEKIKLAKVVK